MSKAGLLGLPHLSLGQTFFATVVGDTVALANHCCRADKTSLNADNNSNNNNNNNSIYLNMFKNSAKLMWSYTNNKIKLPN